MKATNRSNGQFRKLKVQLQEAESERKAVCQRLSEKAGKIEKEIQKAGLEVEAAERRYSEVLETMRERRLE